MFRVGQKVVCVDDDFINKNLCAEIPPNLPCLNTVYTVREIINDWGREFLRLCEITNAVAAGIGVEPAFSIKRFRPVVERKTDISIFTAMLNPSKQKVRA